jgi:hypothetical protein
MKYMDKFFITMIIAVVVGAISGAIHGALVLYKASSTSFLLYHVIVWALITYGLYQWTKWWFKRK